MLEAADWSVSSPCLGSRWPSGCRRSNSTCVLSAPLGPMRAAATAAVIRGVPSHCSVTPKFAVLNAPSPVRMRLIGERGMTKLARVTTTVWILILLLAATRGSAAAQAASPEEQLAQKYAPIAMLRQQTASCDKEGEGYFPAPVDLVLGNPEVALKQIGSTDNAADDTVIKMGPTAQDLAGKDDTYYLDFPGDPRKAKCDLRERLQTIRGTAGHKADDLRPHRGRPEARASSRCNTGSGTTSTTGTTPTNPTGR